MEIGIRFDGRVAVIYTAGANEPNVASISRDAFGNYLIEDLGATITPVPNSGCTASDANHASCDGTGVQTVLVTLGDLDDELTVMDSAYPQPMGEFPLSADGGGGRDTLSGGAGADDLAGGPGGDPMIAGGGGDDSMQGGEGNDVLDGGDGSDGISGGDGNDTVLGGAGDDRGLAGGSGGDTVDGGDGSDDARGNGGADTMIGGPGDDVLDVDEGSVSDGADGPDTLDGGSGADILGAGPSPGPTPGGVRPAQGPDTFSGGDGVDTANFSQRTEPLTIDIDGDADDGESGEGGNVQPDVERVIAGSNGDTLTGSSAANFLDGRDGEDTIEGLGGDDTLRGGANDPSGDNLSGGSGNDAMSGESGDDSLVGGDGDDVEAGGGGGDRVEGEGGNDSLTGGAGVDELDGGDGDDALNGGELVLIGGDGPDVLIGGAGADVLRGGRGNDLLDGGLGPDYISGESETDTVTYEDRTSEVFVTLDGVNNDGEVGENDNVLPDVERIRGGLENDDLSGDADANTVEGGSGEDLIDGALDPDRLLGGDSPDIVRARDGVRDEVACGDGGDLAIADVGDKVIECETVDRPGARRPIVGRYALVRPREQFGLRLPEGRRFFALTEELKVPLGSTIDPRAGVIRLATARNPTGARRVALVSAGRFTVRQRGGRRPVTKLRLAGRLPDCRPSSPRQRSAKQQARASTRRLRVNAGRKSRRARFEVRGRYSVGGSFGTEWITEDTCEGTRTRVISGTVRVRDLVHRRTVMVRPGRPYLAAP